MGVKNLWDILESCKKTLPLHHLQNKRLCVDLSCWLIQLQNASKCAAAAKEKLYLKSLFHRLRALIALNCTLIFVTDGSIPSIKLSTYRRRLGSVSEVAREERVPELPSLRRNMGSEFSCMIKEAKVLGLALGIPCLDGLEEAEAQCALLNSASLCDGCFSADSDIFLFGARTVYRDIFLGEGGFVVCYDMADIERKLGFGRNSLISLALLLGSDYSQGVHGFGRETACKIVKSIGDDAILQHIVSEGLAIVRKTKGKKKQGEMLNCDADKENRYDQKIYERQMSGSDKHFMQVINAYLKPKCHSAESDAVRRVCTQHAFCRTDLQEICDRFFGWSPDITDQYILPKIAERDLRRFANLCSISSELGVRIPSHKIPVACPLSAILKQRKIQGRECFEVSWKDIDGLQISVVPADLVESACPEKIVEFREKKDEAKKQKRASRSRKSSKVSVSKVDVQLQHMLLNVESQSEALPNTTECESTPEDAYESVDVQFESLLLNVESQSRALLHTTKHLSTHETRVDTFESVVIDLSSPSPPLRACKLAKKVQDVTNHLNVIDVAEVTMRPKNKSQHVDVVDVYESENDVTPEHERKARELRLFINKIRGDLY